MAKKVEKTSDTLTYSDAYQELQDIVNALQRDEISIDDLAEKVKRGEYLVQYCQDKLRQTEEAIR